MEWVYRTSYKIPELGAEPGDMIVVAPAAEVPLVVVREFDRNRLPMVLEHLDSLTPLPSSGDQSAEPLSEHLRRAVGSDWHGARPPLRVIR